MSRKLVYLNGQNESITFETGPYLIVKIEGLGIPNVDRQEQKAPYQDGTTYIDSLLQNRDIVVELAITKPNDFPNIALYRRELSQRLTPKYGLGTLTYTDEDGNSYNLRAVVSSMVFPNKDFRDPYMRAMVTFTACDPYWKNVTATTISLPTSVTSAPAIVNSGNSTYETLIQLADDSFLISYVSGALPGVVVRRKTGATWGAEETVHVGSSAYTSIIQLTNGNLFIVYKRNSDNYLVSRTYTGGAWSVDSIITMTLVSYPCVIQLADSSLFLVYKNEATGNIQSQTYITSWSVAVDCFLGSFPKVIQQVDGQLAVVYTNSSSFPSVRYYNGSWGSETIITATTSVIPTIIQRKDRSLLVLYTRISDSYILSQVALNNAWQSPMIVNANASFFPTVVEYDDSDLAIAYSMDIASPAPYRLMEVFRSITPVPAVNTGDVPAPILVTFQGPSVNPRIINQNTLEYIRLNTTLAAADSFEVDTSFGNKTVKLIQGGIVKNGIAFLDIGSTFFQIPRPTLPDLPPGVNPFRGLKAYWNMDSVPEIPTATGADLTYLQDAWADFDGWTGSNCTLSVLNGSLVITATAENSSINFVTTMAANKTVKAKISASQATTVNIRRYLATSHLFNISSVPVICDAYISESFTAETLRIEFNNLATSGEVAQIQFIYIGTGAYLPNSLVDNSGNGNHGTIYGATPVPGISGKALAFDGVDDYVETTNIFSVPDIMHFGFELPFGHSHTAIYQTFLSINGFGLFIARPPTGASQDALQIWNNSGVGQVLSFPGLFTGFSTARLRIDVVMDFITGVVAVYRNGSYFGTATWTVPSKPVGYKAIIGKNGAYLLTGTIDEPRIYNRSLSAEEVEYLFDNPGVPMPTDATVIYYEDDAVLSTATASLEFTERYSGL